MPLQQGVTHEQYHSQGRFAGPMCHLQPLLARRVVWINELEFQIGILSEFYERKFGISKTMNH